MSAPLRVQVGQMALRSILRTLRQPELIAPALVFPLFLLAVNAGGLSATTQIQGFPGHSYLGFALAITFMQGALFATTTVGINLAEDARTGFLQRLSLSPVRGSAILAAELAGSSVLATAQATLYISVGLLSGATIRTGPLGALALVVLTVLTANAFAALGAFWALRTGSGEKVQALFPLLFAVFFLSSLFLPRDLITTDWFRVVATYNPVSYMIEGMRALIGGGWDAGALVRAFACAGGLLVVSLALATASLRSRFSGDIVQVRSHGRSIAAAVAWRNLRVTLRSPGLLLPPVLFPVFLFVAFAGGLSGVGRAPHFGYPDFKAFLFVFVLMQSAAFGGVFAGVALAGDLECGLVRRVMLAAPRRTPILAGHLLAAIARAAIATTLLTALAFGAGMHVAGGARGLAAVLGLSALVTLGATLFAAGVALRLRTTQAAPLMQVPVFLSMFLAPVYTPRHLMTGWVRTAADVNPVTLLLETGRSLLAGQAGRLAATVAVLLAAVAVLAVWALDALRRAETDAA
jgi:ABC-2 type transport system permease protein